MHVAIDGQEEFYRCALLDMEPPAKRARQCHGPVFSYGRSERWHFISLAIRLGCDSLSQRSHHLLVEPDHYPLAAIRDQRHAAGLAGLEADGGAGRNVEAH